MPQCPYEFMGLLKNGILTGLQVARSGMDLDIGSNAYSLKLGTVREELSLGTEPEPHAVVKVFAERLP